MQFGSSEDDSTSVSATAVNMHTEGAFIVHCSCVAESCSGCIAISASSTAELG